VDVAWWPIDLEVDMRGFDLIANLLDEVLSASQDSTHGTSILHRDCGKDEVEDLVRDFVGLLDLYQNRVGWTAVAVLIAVDKGYGVCCCVLSDKNCRTEKCGNIARCRCVLDARLRC
jgi:hypothetical protein